MTRIEMEDKLGLYVDDELPAGEAQRVRAHLAECDSCRAEVTSLRELAAAVADGRAPAVPSTLWTAIERNLSERNAGPIQSKHRRYAHRVMPIAAAIALVVGLGGLVTFVQQGESTAQASTIDFSVILDALPVDPQRALSRFLTLYNGTEIAPGQAHKFAPDLDFEIPAVLPGGFQRSNTYGLRFGSNPGVAARYEKSGELLVTIFHPTVHSEQFGTYKDYPCIVGAHHGHLVEVGEWRLVHVTDPVTCHCVLSRLNEDELAPILNAVAPLSKGTLHGVDSRHDTQHSP